jgi:hypothetical protein
MLAGQHLIDPKHGPNRLLLRLADNEQVLIQAYDLVAGAEVQGRRIAPAGEWLLDNFYLIEQQIRLTRLHLPRTYSRELPRLLSGAAAGFPRVYDIALELIAHVDGRVDAENVSRFVTAYQSVTPLTLGELWAVPIMLRLGLIENLRCTLPGGDEIGIWPTCGPAAFWRRWRKSRKRSSTCWRRWPTPIRRSPTSSWRNSADGCRGRARRWRPFRAGSNTVSPNKA